MTPKATCHPPARCQPPPVCCSRLTPSVFSPRSSVVDLLQHLNASQHVSGVSRLQDPSGATYRIRPRAPHLTLPREYSRALLADLRGALGVHLVGRQAAGTAATLLSLTSATSSPGLQIVSSTLDLTLRVLAAGGSFVYPGRNPFSRDQWVRLAVSLEADRLTFFVDCDPAAELRLRGGENVSKSVSEDRRDERLKKLQVPRDVVITLGSAPGKKESKFSVSFFSPLDSTAVRESQYDQCFFCILSPAGIPEDGGDFNHRLFKATLAM